MFLDATNTITVITLIGGAAMLVWLNLESRRRETKLREYSDNLDRAQQIAGICNWTYCMDSQNICWSPQAEKIFGSRVPQKYGDIRNLIHPEDLILAREQWKKAMKGDTVDFEHRLVIDGEVKWVREQVKFDTKGTTIKRGTGTIQDITMAHHKETQLIFAASVFANASDGIMIAKPDGIIIDINAAMQRITGYQADEMQGRTPGILRSGTHNAEFYASLWRELNEKDIWIGDIWNQRKNGTVYLQKTSIVAVRNQSMVVTHYIALATDVTEIHNNEQVLSKMAYYDTVTNLPNRRMFTARLDSVIDAHEREGGQIAIGYLDLDGFKPVNDRYGHTVGDELLKIISQRIVTSLRGSDIASRLGGDEFAILFKINSIQECDVVASRILEKISEPIVVPLREENNSQTIEVRVTGSMGITIYPEDQANSDVLMRHADQAMYAAKTRGKNCYQMFSAQDDRVAHQHHEMIARIGESIEKNEFVAFYQPKVDIAAGRVIGLEALTRWQRDGEYIPPNEFLQDVELSTMAVKFSITMLRTVMKDILEWRAQDIFIPVSVNIFASNLQDENFPIQVKEVLNEYPDIPPEMIEFEIVESSHIGDFISASKVLMECQAMGIQFSIDDFGTGFSSLAYLRKLPVQSLKIDQSFVRDMLSDHDDLVIVSAVINLAKAFNYKVIAEGVETADIGQKLIDIGCRYAQGYAISKPIAAERVSGWIREWEAKPTWLGLGA